MTTNEKKMAAALAAVAVYMQQEHPAALKAGAPLKAPRFDLNLWGQSGRQGMMHLRSMMQMKAFDRFR